MDLKLHGYLSLGTGNAEFGDIIIRDSRIVNFDESTHKEMSKSLRKVSFPIRRREYEVVFLEKYEAEYESVKAYILTKDNVNFGINLTLLQKLQLKWMLKAYWIQKKNNALNIFMFIVLTLFTFVEML